MTATDELRRMLDERGVEWEDASPVPSMKPWKTSFTSFTGEEVALGCYEEPKWIMGTMVFHTPEQAIEATLGRGTCKVDTEESLFLNIRRWHICGCCGTGFSLWYYTEDGDECEETPHYCPNCGRRCVG